MKIWNGYSTEHSARLVMIGRFEEEKDAKTAKKMIDELTEQAQKDHDEGHIVFGNHGDRYSDEMLKKLSELNIGSVGYSELEQLLYDVSLKQEGKELRIDTDEIDVSVFMKILVLEGAKVEVFSGHNYDE